jgi:tetratricopeptide (TPR) repeat protein
MALLGSLKLESGQLEFGFKMLQRALELQPQVDWSTRAEAEADLGLAYLMMGEEANGLRWLKQAQQRFESDGRVEMLAKSLRNESGYWKHKGKHKAEIEAIDERLEKLENGGADVAHQPVMPHAQTITGSIIRLPAQ